MHSTGIILKKLSSIDVDEFIIGLLFILAPHTKYFLSDTSYSMRPVDIFFIIVLLLLLVLKKRIYWPVGLGVPFAIFYGAQWFSVFWGVYELNLYHVFVLTDGYVSYSYWEVAVRKIVLVTICCAMVGYIWRYGRKVDFRVWLRYWFFGLLFAVLLHTLSYVFSGNFLVYRGGVFLEGNHAGAYYLPSFFLMWAANTRECRFAKFGMGLAVFGLLLSQSTSGLIILIIILWPIFYFRIRRAKSCRRILHVAFVLGSVLLPIALLLLDNPIREKLFGEELNESTYSRIERLLLIEVGLRMFSESPIFGVGLQVYGFLFSGFMSDFSALLKDEGRRIVNNIYIEVLAEQGVVGLFVFLWLNFRIFLFVLKKSSDTIILLAAFISVLLSWFAFPSFTVSFHWIIFAILMISDVSKRNSIEFEKASGSNVNPIIVVEVLS